MTRDTAERARELIYKLQEHVTVGETFKGGACASWTYDKCVALILAHDTQIQAEARLEGLKEAFLLRPRLVKEWDSAQFREGYYSGLEAFRQAIQAVLAQALQPEEREGT